MALTASSGAALCADVKELLEKGDPMEALRMAETGLEKFIESGDKAGEASALFMQATAQSKVYEEDPAATLVVAQQALTALKADGEKKDVAAATLMVGELYAALGELDEAAKKAKDARTLYESLNDINGVAECGLLVSDVHLIREEAEYAVAEAEKAYSVFEEDDVVGLMASAKHKAAKALHMNGQSLLSLRAAEAAGKLWHDVKDFRNEASAIVTEAMAKVAVFEDRDEKVETNVWVMNLVMTAVKMAKKYKKHDPQCLGSALFTGASVLLNSNGLKQAMKMAKEAVRYFRKAGMEGDVAKANLIWASAEYRLGLWEDAQERCQRVISVLDRSTDTESKAKALDLMDLINYSLGQPTRAELAEFQRRQMQQQQQFMMQQRFMVPPQGAQLAVQAAPQEEEAPAGPAAPFTFNRDGSPLDMSAGMDPAIIMKKINELAGQIIGDTEDLEMDTPLMEAGLTSNSAVLLRDELTKDLPGINLPPTLIFDYPSVQAITDFVVEASKKLKK